MQDLSFDEIAKRIKAFNLPHFDLVIGIAEGGKVPAGIIAYKLDADLNIIKISFRDESNTPLYDQPIILSDVMEIKNKKILIVDDVSVTGKTLEKARRLFPGNEVKTLALKGTADYVVFPEIKDCVNWPWRV
ncbi:MAG TPA: phosphoribosyltransferase [Ignavibacteriaceae bacterium]|nr:phosphoribosyltransferase [Ignavibacteriaceae bacterium]